jgi:hypothetical protein
MWKNQQHSADKGIIIPIIGNILPVIVLRLTYRLIGNILLLEIINGG